MSDTASRKHLRWPRKSLLALLGAVIVFSVAWRIAESLINIGQHRGRVEALITQKTGLPASIQALNLDIFPAPSLWVYGLRVGDDTFGGGAEAICVKVSLVKALSRRIHVTDVKVTGITGRIPKDPAEREPKLSALMAALTTPGDSRGATFTIDRVRSAGARLFMTSSETPDLVFAFDIRDVMAPHVSIEGRGAIPFLGERAGFDASGKLLRTPGEPLRIEGRAAIRDADLGALLDNPVAEETVFELTADILAPSLSDFAFDLSGTTRPRPEAPEEYAALAGEFTGEAWLRGGELIVNDLAWRADGLSLTADITRHADGAVAVEILSAEAGSRALEALLEPAGGGRIRLAALPSARAEIENFYLGAAPGAALSLTGGTLNAEGLALLDETDRPLLPPVTIAGSVQDAQLTLERVEGEGVALKGTITPQFETDRVAIELDGTLALRPEWAALTGLGDTLKNLYGQVEIKRFSATIAEDQGITDDLLLEGELSGAGLDWISSGFADTFTALSGPFTATGAVIGLDLTAVSAQLGETRIQGEYDWEQSAWRGTLHGDLARAAGLFQNETARLWAEGALGAYGASTLAIEFTRAPTQKNAPALTLVRKGSPPLAARLWITPGAEGLSPGRIEAEGELPLEALAEALPSAIRGQGMAVWNFERDPNKGTFRLNAALTSARVEAGDFITKLPGAPFDVSVTGPATSERWATDRITLDLLGERVEAALRDGAFDISTLRVRLEPLAALLREGAHAGGLITGRIHGPPLSLDLRLEGAGLSFTPELTIGQVTGAVKFDGGIWTLRDLRVAGANSECRIDAGLQGGLWRGTITGAKLDVNALTETITRFRSLIEDSDGEESAARAASPSPSAASELAIEIAEVYYRKARFDQVHAQMNQKDGVTRITDILAAAYGGTLTGAIEIAPSPDRAPKRLSMNFALDNVGAQIIDGAVLDMPRGFSGALTGVVDITVPLTDDPPPIHGANGTIVLTGQKGSFGKMGLTTKLVTALRTTEILRLRLPPTRDEGLTFDTCSIKLSLGDGVMTIEEAVSKSPSLELVASGTIDFPKDTMNVSIRANPLESVTGLVARTPVVGRVAGGLTRANLVFTAKGSPYDPQVSMVPGQGIRDAVGGAIGNIIRR